MSAHDMSFAFSAAEKISIAENISTFFMTPSVNLFDVTTCHHFIDAVLNIPVSMSKNDMSNKSPSASLGSSRYEKRKIPRLYPRVFSDATIKSINGEKKYFAVPSFSIIKIVT